MILSNRNKLLNHYFFLSYLVILTLCSGYLKSISFSGTKSIFYVTAVYLSYSFIYLLPALLLTKTVHWLQYWLKKDTPGRMKWLVYTVAIIGTGMTELTVLGDCNVYSIYNFHLNGFVWNLITAPGGIESMGVSSSTNMILIAILFGVLFLQIILLWVVALFLRRRPPEQPLRTRRTYLYLLIIFIALTLGERITYGVSKLQAYEPVLTASNAFPFYMPMTFYHLAKKLGYNVHREKNLHVSEDSNEDHVGGTANAHGFDAAGGGNQVPDEAIQVEVINAVNVAVTQQRQLGHAGANYGHCVSQPFHPAGSIFF